MNERIKELLEQSTDVYDEWKTGKSHSLVDHKMFAELIVRECLDIISPYAVRMENFDGGHPISEIKQHFGVE